MSTIFSNIPEDKWISSNELSFAILDIYPASDGHTLVIPKREIETFFELSDGELIAIKQLIVSRKEEISLNDPTVEGFNIFINNGKVAGQTVFHLHFHLIPRRKGDNAWENYFQNLRRAKN
ncbi:MAG: HIT family protein [Dehalococcoidia bacterium]